jgi:hypothetical protein
MKPCSRRCVRLWTNTDKAASEVVAVFDALRNPQADSSMPGGLATASDGLRALMGCGDVQALPPPFSQGAPQFAPHASNALSAEPLTLYGCQAAAGAANASAVKVVVALRAR